MTIALRAALLLVMWAEASSIWVGLTDRPRYAIAFPAATGALYWVTIATSLAAGLNAIVLWVPRLWAIALNVAIGAWSIILIEIVGGPRVNQLIAAVACTVTTALAWLVWRRGPTGRDSIPLPTAERLSVREGFDPATDGREAVGARLNPASTPRMRPKAE